MIILLDIIHKKNPDRVEEDPGLKNPGFIQTWIYIRTWICFPGFIQKNPVRIQIQVLKKSRIQIQIFQNPQPYECHSHEPIYECHSRP